MKLIEDALQTLEEGKKVSITFHNEAWGDQTYLIGTRKELKELINSNGSYFLKKVEEI